jgi:hypothetical protein
MSFEKLVVVFAVDIEYGGRGERGKAKKRWWYWRLRRFILRVVHVTSCCR